MLSIWKLLVKGMQSNDQSCISFKKSSLSEKPHCARVKALSDSSIFGAEGKKLFGDLKMFKIISAILILENPLTRNSVNSQLWQKVKKQMSGLAIRVSD